MKYATVTLAIFLAGCGLAGTSDVGKSDGRPGEAAWERPVGKAVCGATDRPETALQGQVPMADRLSGRSQQGYNCNLELVGQHQGTGASWQHAWYNDCAYYDTAARGGAGTVVVDASDPSNPHASAYLTEPAMLDPWESLKVNQQRGLLAGVQNGGPGFAVYDLTGDCREPRLLASIEIPGTSGHEGNWGAPDGRTYIGSDIDASTYYPIDMTDPANPQLLLNWQNPSGTHGISVSDDGTRGYFVLLNLAPHTEPNGFIVVDLTDIQSRKPDPEIRVISTTTWVDGATAQHTIPIRIKGRPFLVHVDELGAGGIATNGGWTYSCASGLPPYGFARIFDMTDETAPRLVSKLMLETHDPANCEVVTQDTDGQGIFGYDSHYCYVDDPHETTVVGCGYENSGLRVFDVRDPWHPREIAYFNPPAQLAKQNDLPGSNHIGVKNADWCSSQVRFIKERGEIWSTCQDNGFMILKFTNGVWPFSD